jgi:hypothetical protein
VYAQSAKQETTSALIAYSLALYMLGISISLLAFGLFANFTVSLFIALALFAMSIAYLQVFIASSVFGIPTEGIITNSRATRRWRDSPGNWIRTALSPLESFKGKPVHLLVGLSLLSYNIFQSYVFNALMVHTSMHFGFTGRENGFILSIAHSVAATYIGLTIFFVPSVSRRMRKNSYDTRPTSTLHIRNLRLALLSLALQTLSLVAMGCATRPWQEYCITILLAIGLCTPSFIKAYFMSLFESANRPSALAALAMMETLGSILGPLVPGGLQSYFSRDTGIFFVAAGFSIAVFLSLLVGSFPSDMTVSAFP